MSSNSTSNSNVSTSSPPMATAAISTSMVPFDYYARYHHHHHQQQQQQQQQQSQQQQTSGNGTMTAEYLNASIYSNNYGLQYDYNSIGSSTPIASAAANNEQSTYQHHFNEYNNNNPNHSHHHSQPHLHHNVQQIQHHSSPLNEIIVSSPPNGSSTNHMKKESDADMEESVSSVASKLPSDMATIIADDVVNSIKSNLVCHSNDMFDNNEDEDEDEDDDDDDEKAGLGEDDDFEHDELGTINQKTAIYVSPNCILYSYIGTNDTIDAVNEHFKKSFAMLFQTHMQQRNSWEQPNQERVGGSSSGTNRQWSTYDGDDDEDGCNYKGIYILQRLLFSFFLLLLVVVKIYSTRMHDVCWNVQITLTVHQ